MAQFTFSQMVAAEKQSINNNQANGGNGNNYNSVTFFSLKNDQEKAFVRFIFDKPDEDLECLATHEVYIGGKARKINCLRESASDPLEKCPICQRTAGIKNRAYLKMIQYTKDSEGNYVASPKVWERSISFIKNSIVPLQQFYPNGISEAICQITRIGKAGSKETTYNIMPVPNVSPELQKKCVLDKNLFKNYKALGTIVLNKSYNEILSAINSGEYQIRTTTPAGNDTPTPKANNTYNNFVTTTPTPVINPTPAPTQAPAQSAPAVETIAYDTSDMPF